MTGPGLRSGAFLFAVMGIATLAAVQLAAGQVPEGLRPVATEMAEAWRQGRLEQVAARGDDSGILLYIEGQGHGRLAGRQAMVALAAVRDRYEAGSLRIEDLSLAGGDPDQAFAELSWETVARGTSEALMFTVYVGFVLRAEEWRVAEVRLIR